ncbi:MAG TPA: phosphatidylserine decarboxylase [Sedimentisphaerales bacterium]|nr:phosphatidylserine decarboxylase [Sedimentisphaerales bacterium]HRS12331.1 phosphatidylserine decarboxylase [Sedimentisphaerales bacterium]HRV49002.1 phosphatidylserine decarboxylase [Sedimentisphaerales bacterium]
MTRYGWPQVVVYPVLMVVAMLAVALGGAAHTPLWAVFATEALLAVVLVWALMFFRDPRREAPGDETLFVAPADGRVTDIEQMAHSEFLDGPAVRIGIFLSIFDVHINRCPCSARVESIAYRKGSYLNAMNPLSAKVNESNTLTLVRTDAPSDRFVVRQISGAIARRIVCEAREGTTLSQGQAFGMIKFGSRTELYVPTSEPIECLVRIGDPVKAGVTPLLRYGKCDDSDRKPNETRAGS